MKHLKTIAVAITTLMVGQGFSQVVINADMKGLKEGTWIYYGQDAAVRSKKFQDSLQAKQDGFSLTLPVTKENAAFYYFMIGNATSGAQTTSIYLSSGKFNISSPSPDFKNAVYSGSDFADQQTALNKIVNPIMDSINKLPPAQKVKSISSYIYPQLDWAGQHPDAPLSAAVILKFVRLNGMLPLLSNDSLYAAYALLNTDAKQNNTGKMLDAMIQMQQKGAIGKTAYDFNLPDALDKSVSLADFKGKYVLVDFWSSGCGPCIASFPYMKKMYQRFKGNQFEIVGISIDRHKDAWLKALKKYDLPWINVLDTSLSAFTQYGVSGTPTSVLIDPDGNVAVKTIGAQDSDDNPIVQKLTKVLNK